MAGFARHASNLPMGVTFRGSYGFAGVTARRFAPLLSGGVVEGLNLKAKLAMRKAYGFGEYSFVELALYHAMADLPELETAHKFF